MPGGKLKQPVYADKIEKKTALPELMRNAGWDAGCLLDVHPETVFSFQQLFMRIFNSKI